MARRSGASPSFASTRISLRRSGRGRVALPGSAAYTTLMSRTASLAALLVALAVPAHAEEASRWTRLDGGFFTIELPGQATLENSENEVPGVGTLKSTSWTVESPDSSVVINTTEFPKAFVADKIPGKMLEGSRDGAVANIGATLTADEPVFIPSGLPKKKWPGRVFTATRSGGLVIRQAVYLVDHTLLQVVYATSKPGETDALFARVHASLKMVPAGKATGKSSAKAGPR